MKTRTKISSFVVFPILLSILGGCVAQNHHTLDSERVPSSSEGTEIVEYNWKTEQIRVSFYRQFPETLWQITVRDMQDSYNQHADGSTIQSRVSTSKCFQVLQRSFVKFLKVEPRAEIGSMAVEMHLIHDLWAETCSGLQRRLTTVHGEKPSNRIEVPDEVGDEVWLVLNRSSAIADLKKFLQNHGLTVRTIEMPDHILFRDSLGGKKWSDFATLPNVGIMFPGMFGFDLGTSRLSLSKEKLCSMRERPGVESAEDHEKGAPRDAY